VRGRLGWLFTPQALVYGTGGLAYGETETSTSLSQTGTNGFVGFAYGVHSEWLWGWTIGAGLEWKFWSNASLKVEYLHYNLGSVTYTSVPTSAFFPNSIGTPLNHATSDFEGDIIRAGLNWQFNWGFPNVAAY
jgi:outer membrane immunogenic protein